ncbi:hypothetical protein UFOVP46_89 [uncultured Caudovirales phage]|uniref:Uncharacterized protein n=1 Tax=uncultured Caudovirales phage TaxID=2100421 RepID=A0A6J5KR71_9CAUD|nr:hypothetical protein UFOVP46_89 [uncultured Caudovirales phage]
MVERIREVVGEHSTWHVCDEHGWDFTNEGEDTCPVCKGEALAEARIVNLLEEHEAISDGSEGGNPAVCSCQQWSLTSESYEDHIKRLIKGEK